MGRGERKGGAFKMSVLHCNLARPDFRKYNFEKAAPAVQGPIVSLPVLFQAFHAQGEVNQQLIELDQGRVGTSLRQIDVALAEQRLARQRFELGEAALHHSSHQQAATAAVEQKRRAAKLESDRDEARASEQEAAARRCVQGRAERARAREESLQALQSRVDACATAARQAREERTSAALAGLIQDHEVRQGERCSGALPVSRERWLNGRVADRPNWPDSSHVSGLAELGRVFRPNGRKR